ncbi:hypothetical protein MC885_021189 [Smutsia gigantea]|nr:hypothetical protein MC885_021189 [Smutsia gigantea]
MYLSCTWDHGALARQALWLCPLTLLSPPSSSSFSSSSIWSMSLVLTSQGPSRFFPSSPFGSWSSGVFLSTASMAFVPSTPSWRP